MDERRKSGVTKRGAPTVSNMPRRGRELVDALYKHLLTGKPLAPRDRTELISRLTWFDVDPRRTLDEVLGIQKLDPRRAARQIRLRDLLDKFTVAQRLVELHDQGHALTNVDAFGQVARELGIKLTEIKEHWRVAKRFLGIKLERKPGRGA